MATERQVLERLRGLEPDKWAEVMDFIDYPRQRPTTRRAQKHTKQLTARDLLQSGILGLWSNRRDIDDSAAFARQLRRQAGRRGDGNDPAR